MYVLPYGQMSLWGLIVEPQMFSFYLIWFYFLFITPIYFNIKSKVNKLKGIYRIGPHNQDIISIIFGSLLGNGIAEKKLTWIGTRISFYHEAVQVEYLLQLHKIFSDWGYCNTKIPNITTRLGIKGKLRKVVRFTTWTYTSFNWIYDLWYKDNIKCVPNCINQYLTPLALAIWIMDDGTKVSNGLKFSTNSFSYNDCLLLIKALNDNFNIKSSIQSTGNKNQYIIFIWKESIDDLRNIVSQYIIPEMKYKLN